MIGIYKISRNGQVVYIGQSRNIQRRISDHKLYMQRNDTRHENRYLCNACQKYGIDAFEFDVVEELDLPERLTEREGYWIEYYDFPNGNYAIPKDGDDWTVSEEFIEKYLRGENNPNYGNRWTDEQKKAMSEKKIGVYKGENNPNYGNREANNPLTKHICPYETTAELQEALKQYEGFCGLAKHLNVPRATVQHWCEHRNIPYKKRDYVEGFGIREPDVTREEFLTACQTMKRADVCAHFGITAAEYRKWGKRFNIDFSAIKRPYPLEGTALITEVANKGISAVMKEHHMDFYVIKRLMKEAEGGGANVGNEGD